LTRIEHITSSEPGGGLRKLNQLLEATALLHSQLPLDEVLATMLDHTGSITDADRGLLLEPDAGGALRVPLARRRGTLRLPPESPAACSKLDRQILDALAADAASILDNARLVERERERQRLEQEINIARDIQQALLPRNFPDTPNFCVTGVNFPCLSVGGDYFD